MQTVYLIKTAKIKDFKTKGKIKSFETCLKALNPKIRNYPVLSKTGLNIVLGNTEPTEATAQFITIPELQACSKESLKDLAQKTLNTLYKKNEA